MRPNTEPNPFDKYGVGAESKLRLQEGSNFKNVNAPYYAAPISEGRMRSQEQTRFVTPEFTPSQEFERRHSKPIQEIQRSNKNVTTKLLPTVQPSKSVASNPFDEDDDSSNIDYDESKNPFANDETDSTKPDVAKEISNHDKQTSNPFGEYDSNLNPFD